MAADPYPTTPVPRAGDAMPVGTDTLRPVSFAALFVQDLPKLPSLAALRALTDHELPSTDGLPMPESTVQGPPLRYTVSALDWVFKARRPGDMRGRGLAGVQRGAAGCGRAGAAGDGGPGRAGGVRGRGAPARFVRDVAGGQAPGTS